jgi:hypothetical protein
MPAAVAPRYPLQILRDNSGNYFYVTPKDDIIIPPGT